MEGFYQVLNLLVDAYRVAMGIEQIHLADEQWTILLKDMPTKGKEVIPCMLSEQRLLAENPTVCDALLGGLLHAQLGHMMTAQAWASNGVVERRAIMPIEGKALINDEKREWEA